MKIELEQKVEAFKVEVETLGITEVMQKYREIEARRKQLSEQVDFAKALEDALEQRMANYLIETQQESAGTPFGVAKRVLKETYYVEDKVAFRNWAIANEREELMSISVTQKAIKDFVETQAREYRERVAEGEQLPPFEVQLPTGLNTKQEFKISITKK